MRVLDIGCGAGDVSIIAADLVGPEGCVQGIDPATEALSLARARLDALGKPWVRFATGTIEGIDNGSEFDAVIGRFVLIHLADPAGALRNLMQSLRPGTSVVFAELDLGTAAVDPPLPLLQQCVAWIGEVYRRAGRHTEMGAALYGAFRSAGAKPQMIGLTRVTDGEDRAGYQFLVESVRSLMPAMEKLGIAAARDIGIDTLEQRLLAEAASGDHCIFYPRLVGAWAKVQ